jgi:hypothetical protein
MSHTAAQISTLIRTFISPLTLRGRVGNRAIQTGFSAGYGGLRRYVSQVSRHEKYSSAGLELQG